MSVDVKATPRFLQDARNLANTDARKLEATLRLLRDEGTSYPSLRTRPIQRHPDPRFRFMNVDDGCRIVAAVEGRLVVLMKVGKHDETELWGERASLRDLEERLELDSTVMERRKRADAKGMDALLEVKTSLAEIVASDQTSDLITDCVDGVLEGWRDGTIEEWMVFLSPVQRRAVDRAVGGPARVTGGPGTGKSVVGLHRAVAFAREQPVGDQILMTSFVRTVPEVLGGLFERLEPHLAPNVAFASVHSLAMKALGPHRPRVDGDLARKRFDRVLRAKADRYRQLSVGARLGDDYLWEEITRVIEGRGLVRRSSISACSGTGASGPSQP